MTASGLIQSALLAATIKSFKQWWFGSEKIIRDLNSGLCGFRATFSFITLLFSVL